MAASHREVERKYAVAPGFVVPSLDGLPGVAEVGHPETVTLEAIYYDSEDLRLARNKITLRRRTGGSDAGWHLKLPVKAGERDEFHHPLEDAAASGEPGAATADSETDSENGVSGGSRRPPEELIDLVLVHLRGAQPRPVARLVTTRTARHLCDDTGAELVEVVDDAVSAQTLGERTELSAWRELEVELVGGDATLLDKVDQLLAAAGAAPSKDSSKLARVLGSWLDDVSGGPGRGGPRPQRVRRGAPAGAVVGAYVAAQVEALVAIDPRVRLDEPDAVHKMRVASRRLRSTLRTYGALFDEELAARLDGELGDLAGALSGARDTEVQIEYFDGRVASLPDDLVFGPVKESIDNYLSDGLVVSRDEALTMLRSERYFALVGDLLALVDAPLAGPAKKPAHKVLPELVLAADDKLSRKILKAQAASGHERDVQLHSARKQAKRLRYAAEALVSLYGDDATAFARLAESVQEVLGVHQDACIARSLLRQWGVQAQAAGQPTAFTFGLLLGLEECRAHTAERDFFEMWPEASRARHRRWLH